ncbi:hypothetical protein [Yaniella halotolerans]|uniref:hypothetical protein n=1 Tax=Yaniella halotolerans TaxID=225453 RepID=UPI0003B66236|nr:hypothetical protein [Yaniella halotolerans]
MSKKTSQSTASKVVKGLYRRAPESVRNRIKRIVAESLPQPTSQPSATTKTNVAHDLDRNAQKIAMSPDDIGSTYNSDMVLPMLALEHDLLHKQLRNARQETQRLRKRLNENNSRKTQKNQDQDSSADNTLVDKYLEGQRNSTPRHLVLTGQYPSHTKKRQHNHLHQRIKSYLAAGIAVDTVVTGSTNDSSIIERNGVRLLFGQGRDIATLLAHEHYTSVSVHFLTADIWTALKPFLPVLEVHIFVHGRETSRWVRNIPTYKDGKQLEQAIERSIESQHFWQDVLSHPSQPKTFIFRSPWWLRAADDDLRTPFPSNRVHILPDRKTSDVSKQRATLDHELFILGLGD